MLVTEALADFLAEQTYKGNSVPTHEFYERHLAMFVRQTGVTRVEDITRSLVRDWLLRQQGLSRMTLATYDRAVRVFTRWLHRRGYVKQDVMADLPKPKARQPEIELFTPRDIQGMVQAARRGHYPLRDVALVSLLLDTGIRAGEVARLRLDDVGWGEGILRIDGKNENRIVPMGRKAKARLKRYVEEERAAPSHVQRAVFLMRGGVPMLSIRVSQRVRLIAYRAGVSGPKLGPHTFRHTFATEFVRNGGDAFALQRLLGHSTLEMTRRYVNLAGTDLREAHKKYAPGDRLL